MDTEEEKGISLGEIFKVIFKRLWWVLGVTVGVMLIAAILVQFVYNPSKKEYSYTFVWKLRNSEITSYPDSTLFTYSDLQEIDALTEVTKDERFSKIDVTTMADKDDITITRNEEKSDAGTTTVNYTITVKGKYFDDSETAAAFIKYLAETPVRQTNSIVSEMDYNGYFTLYDNAETYEQQVNYLNAQYNLVLDYYDKLISIAGSDYSTGLSETLGTIRTRFVNSTIKNDLSQIQTIVSALNLQKDEALYISRAQARINAIDQNILSYQNQRAYVEQQYKAFLASVKDSGTVVDDNSYVSKLQSFDSTIADLKEQRRIIVETLAMIDSTNADYSSTEHAEYTAKKAEMETLLAKCYSDLKTATDSMKAIRSTVYGNETRIYYTQSTVTVDGGVNVIIGAVAGAVVGFIVVAVVICIIDMPKYLREKAEKEALKAQPAQTTQA